MDGLKPIKKGCTALTYNCRIPENNSKIVRVERFLTSLSIRYKERMWDTDTKTIDNYGVISTWMHEKNLLRIDDPDIEEEVEEELVFIENK